jgi:hypothetical protein
LCCRPFLKEHSLYKVGKVAGKQSTIMRGLWEQKTLLSPCEKITSHSVRIGKKKR